MGDAGLESGGESSDREQISSVYTEAAWKALQHFPVRAESMQLVAHSENVTFRVAAREERTDCVLRLHRPGYSSLAELESERIWTRALKETGVVVPASFRTHDGRHYASIDIPDAGERRFAGMTSWHEGMPLSDHLRDHSTPAERVRIFRRFGEIAATFHNQSTGWTPPQGFVRRRLGAPELLGEDPFWGRFWEHASLTEAERQCLMQARDRLRARLAEYGENPGNFSLIHADFTPDNIIYDGTDLAIIDFDDAGYGWHMYDLASALIECRDAPDIEALQAALIDGYREHRPLSKRDIEMLPAFLLIRGMAIIGWYLQRPEHASAEDPEAVMNWVLEASGC